VSEHAVLAPFDACSLLIDRVPGKVGLASLGNNRLGVTVRATLVVLPENADPCSVFALV